MELDGRRNPALQRSVMSLLLSPQKYIVEVENMISFENSVCKYNQVTMRLNQTRTGPNSMTSVHRRRGNFGPLLGRGEEHMKMEADRDWSDALTS